MPTVASTVSHAAVQRATPNTTSANAAPATGSTGSGLDGAFAQMVTASDGAAAQATGHADAATTSSPTKTGKDTDGTTASDKTTAADSTASTASSDLAGALAVLLQGASIPLATSGGLESPASLGGQGSTVSATTSAKPGIDAGQSTTASGSGSSATPSDATATAASTSTTVTAGDAALAALAAKAVASGTASKTDAGSTTAGTDATNTTTNADTAKADAAKVESAANTLGLQSLVARHTSSEKSTGTPQVYGRPTARDTNGTNTATTTAAGESAQDKLAMPTRSLHTLDDPTLTTTTETKGDAGKSDATPDRAGDPTTPVLTAHADTASPSAQAAAQANQIGAIAPTDHHKATDATATDQTAATATTHAVPMSAVADTIAGHARAGSTHFAIKLNPAELGSVDVRVEVKSSGEVRAHLIVERSDTLDMMMRDQKTLERSLGNAGLDVGSSGLQFSLRDQGNGRNQPDRDQTNTARVGLDIEDSAVTTPDIAAIAYRARRAGGLDLRI